jgi:oligopeptide transport system substrate-binding protein
MSQNRLLAILLGVLASLVLVVGGLSAALLFTGGGDDDDDGGNAGISTDVGTGSDAPAAEGRLRLASGDPVTLDPHLAGDALSAEYIVEIFSGLVTIGPPPETEIQLDLAENLEVSPDGMEYTFTLRDDATFHSGRVVTAEDVRWSIERAASRELGSLTALAYLNDIVGVREYNAGLAETVEGLDVIDERTIKITIDAPKPYFLAKLTYPTAFVVDRQQVESNPRNWQRRPNGTGSYELIEWRLGERIVLRAFEGHHLGPQGLAEAVYLLSGGNALTRFENGELDVASVGLNDIDRARDPSSDLNPLYTAWPQFTVSYIAFNTNVPPFDDIHVRRAMAMAIDRERVAQVTFNNMLSPATGILMPQLPGYTSDVKTLPYDPEAARAELAQSQYAEDMPRIVITEQGAGAEARIDTQAFLEQWRTELGLEVEIRQTDFATLLADQDAGRLQAFNAGWIMDYPDPESILDVKLHSGSSLNDVSYENPEYDSLIEQARVEEDPEERLRLYGEAERLAVEDAVWIPLYFSEMHVVVSEDVQGWFEPPMILPRLRHIQVTR